MAPTTTDVVTLFGAGIVDVSVIPYSNFFTLVDQGAPVKIVAGAGVQGCVLVAAEGITDAAGLKGKSIGTFQADTLEVLPYDYLVKAGLSFADVEVKYFNTSPELAAAFIAGAIDPNRPVAINVIDFGADPDRPVWEAVSQLSGGSYQ